MVLRLSIVCKLGFNICAARTGLLVNSSLRKLGQDLFSSPSTRLNSLLMIVEYSLFRERSSLSSSYLVQILLAASLILLSRMSILSWSRLKLGPLGLPTSRYLLAVDFLMELLEILASLELLSLGATSFLELRFIFCMAAGFIPGLSLSCGSTCLCFYKGHSGDRTHLQLSSSPQLGHTSASSSSSFSLASYAFQLWRNVELCCPPLLLGEKTQACDVPFCWRWYLGWLVGGLEWVGGHVFG